MFELWRESELLRITLASIGDGVITTDTDGRVLSLNRVAESLCGWTTAEAQGRALSEVFRLCHEHTGEAVEDPARRALREGCPVTFSEDTVLVARDGTATPIDDSAAPIRDETGRVHGVVLVFRSVAEQRRSQRESALLAAIVESSQDAIVAKTLESRIVSWNAGAEQLFGYRAEEAIGRPVTLLIPEERLDEEERILARLRRGERIEHYETVRVTKSGRRVDVSLTVSPIRDGSGRIVGASKIARDVSGRKRSEQRLAVQHAVARTLAESASMDEAAPRILRAVCEALDWQLGALWLVDERRSQLRVSHTFHAPSAEAPCYDEDARQRGFERGFGLLGRVWAAAAPVWVPDVTRERSFARLAVAEAERLHAALFFPIVLDERVLGVMEFLSHETREPDEGVLQVVRSIGSQVGQFVERRRAEAALKAADRRKDEFLAMLSHELRNPLAPVRNAVQILRAKGAGVPELGWAAELIDRQVGHMTRLVDDLLDVSRITQGKIELRRETVDLASVVASAVEASRPLMEKWGHELTVSLPSQPVRLRADPIRLAQVIGNLLNNAAKYTPHGGRVQLSAEQQDGALAVRVRDDGIGIPPEVLSRVFDLFAQGERALEHSDGGLGIGLTLVKRLVEMHGGSVEARSEGPGRGSEFVVRLPALADDVAEDSPGRHEPVSAPPRRVLVVDDNRDAADSLGMVLGMMGHEVRTAHDGLEAVEAAADFSPDVIVLDVGLPRLNGYDVARRVREQEGGRAVTLVALTGWGQAEDRERALAAGFDHHMTKPADFEALQRLLAALPRDGR